MVLLRWKTSRTHAVWSLRGSHFNSPNFHIESVVYSCSIYGVRENQTVKKIKVYSYYNFQFLHIGMDWKIKYDLSSARNLCMSLLENCHNYLNIFLEAITTYTVPLRPIISPFSSRKSACLGSILKEIIILKHILKSFIKYSLWIKASPSLYFLLEIRFTNHSSQLFSNSLQEKTKLVNLNRQYKLIFWSREVLFK